MYNTKSIEEFIEKVNKEAEAAAQLVFDKYEAEFKQKVEEELQAGTELYLSMGSSYYVGCDKYNSHETEAFADIVASVADLEQQATFNIWEFRKF